MSNTYIMSESESFFCICCSKIHSKDHALEVFTTGYRRIGQLDIPLGFCKDHLDAYILRKKGTE